MSTGDVIAIAIGTITLAWNALTGWMGERTWDAISQPKPNPQRVADSKNRRFAVRKWQMLSCLAVSAESGLLLWKSAREGMHFPITLHVVIGVSLGIGGITFGLIGFIVSGLLGVIREHIVLAREQWEMAKVESSIVKEIAQRIENSEGVPEDFEDYSPY